MWEDDITSILIKRRKYYKKEKERKKRGNKMNNDEFNRQTTEGTQTNQGAQTNQGTQTYQGAQEYQNTTYNQVPPTSTMISQPRINQTTYMIFAILATVLCCMPLGIPAIVYAAKINNMQDMGDYEGAEKSAKNAKIFTIISAVACAVVVLGYLTLFAFGMVASVGSYSY